MSSDATEPEAHTHETTEDRLLDLVEKSIGAQATANERADKRFLWLIGVVAVGWLANLVVIGALSGANLYFNLQGIGEFSGAPAVAGDNRARANDSGPGHEHEPELQPDELGPSPEE